MLRVTIEIVPFAIEEEKKTLGVIEIVNDLTGSLESGNYQVTLSDEAPFTKDGKVDIWRRVKLKGFRRRAFGPYHILLAALLEAIPEEERS